MATRKWQAARRRRYRTRAVDLRTRPANLARSAAVDPSDQSARDSQAFHALILDRLGILGPDELHRRLGDVIVLEDHGLPLIAIGEAIADRLPDVDDVLAGEVVE